MNKASGGNGIPVELFQILKYDAVKVLHSMCQQICGHRTGKGQFSFQSQRKAIPKNAQTTTQLHPSHMLAGEGNGNPLQYSGLENFMDCIVHGVAKSRTRLSDFHFHFSKYSLNIWKFMVQVLLKADWKILSITLLVCEMSAIVR